MVFPLLAISLLMPLASCGGDSGASSARSSATTIHSRYQKIVLGIDGNEKQFQHNLASLVSQTKASGKLPSQKKLAIALNPLYAGVSQSIVSLSELGVPKSAAKDMGHLLEALASVTTDMREVVATWPNTAAVGSQLKLDVDKVGTFSILEGRDLSK